jgi:hypothetical protein
VLCPSCLARKYEPCRRTDGTAAAVSCPARWARHDEANRQQRRTITAGIIDPDPVADTLRAESIAPVTTEVTVDVTKLMDALNRIPQGPYITAHPDTERRERYGEIIRDQIKRFTFPAPSIGGPALHGATEYDVADAVLQLADAEHADVRGQRDAALRLADVWADAPDPLARAMAADLRTAIAGAPAARLLGCGLCYEEDGEEVHPHPECPVRTTPGTATEATEPCGATSTGMFGRQLGPCTNDTHGTSTFHHDAHGTDWADYPTVGQLRAERDQYAKALDKVHAFNKLVAEGSCRVHAADQARDTLGILERHTRPSTGPSRPEKGPQ